MLRIVYVRDFSWSEEMNNICEKMTHIGTMDRDVTVLKHIHHHLIGASVQ